MSRASGATEQQIRDLARAEVSDAFDEPTRAALALAEAMTQTEVVISDALWNRLRAAFNSAQLVELCAAIAHENLRARLNHALGLEAQGYSEGAACALPERRLPSRPEAGTMAT